MSFLRASRTTSVPRPSGTTRADAVFGVIGRFAVRFRWTVALIWIVGAIAAATQLPALSSVTQSNNTKFLPASAPSMHAATLAAPFGTAGLQPVPVVAARADAPLTAADVAALGRLAGDLKTVSGVVSIRDLGRSADGHAEQLVALVNPNGGNQNYETGLIDGMRARIARAGLPPGLQAHLAGPVAVQVDQQKASGNTGNRVQDFSALFIIVLLVLIFRSFTLALTTLAPAFVSVIIAGPLVAEAARHGLKVSPIAQLLLIVLVLGAGTDYGLFLVFRVREELRNRAYDRSGSRHPGTRGLAGSVLADLRRARPAARDAITWSVTRVGESITFSAGTVVAAVLTLLFASFPFYADLGVPFAIAIGVMLLAGLTLLPALLSIRLSLIAVKRSLFQSVFGRPKLLPWDIQGAGKTGTWGRVAGNIVRRPVLTLVIGLVFFGALALGSLGYKAGGFGGNTTPPAGSDSAAGTELLARHFPQSSANPTSILFKFATPVWSNPAELANISTRLRATGLFTQVAGPLNAAGSGLTPAQYASLHARLGPPQALPPSPPAARRVPPAAYLAYRATANYVSPDGRTVQYSTGLKAGDPGNTPAMNAVPSIRAATATVARSVGAADSAVGGEAPALYDISAISGSDLARVIPIAIVAIGVLLALVMRSLVAPLYLIASVGISYFAALGLATLLFINIGGSSGLVFFLPFLMFIFLLALGEDYNILVMTRIREEAHRFRLTEAVRRALARTGTTVTSAGLVLAGSFVVLTFVAGRGPGGSQVRDIGVGLALGILMDTFLVRTLLVPSTVVLLGRWNWWPSRMSREAPPPVPADARAAVVTAGEPGDVAVEAAPPDHVG
jgi:RND superfamily putative drug exporter